MMEIKEGDIVRYVKGPLLLKYEDKLFKVIRTYSQNSNPNDDIAECMAEGWEDLHASGRPKKLGWYKWRVEHAGGCAKCIYTCKQGEVCPLLTEEDK